MRVLPWGTHERPIDHVVVLMQENRSFDHYLGRLASAGQPEAEGIPDAYQNLDRAGKAVRPFHLPSTCVPADPPHQWDNMRAHWNGGRMDGFIRQAAINPMDDDDDDPTSGGRYALGYYDQNDLPFYYFLARSFAISDRYFSSAMAGTWPNRQFFYTGRAQKRMAPTAMLSGQTTIFHRLDEAAVSWAVFTDGPPRQDCIGWHRHARGVHSMRDFLDHLKAGDLPAVSFLDPAGEDEHPPADVQRGETWARQLFQAVVASPAWPRLAWFTTYDEGGGFFDHVPPPAACAPTAELGEYDRLGTRVPFFAVSPWVRRHHVSHVVHDHGSLLRFIEVIFDLRTLTARDANASDLMDLFDFDSPPRLTVDVPPAAGRGGCRPRRLLTAERH